MGCHTKYLMIYCYCTSTPGVWSPGCVVRAARSLYLYGRKLLKLRVLKGDTNRAH